MAESCSLRLLLPGSSFVGFSPSKHPCSQSFTEHLLSTSCVLGPGFSQGFLCSPLPAQRLVEG